MIYVIRTINHAKPSKIVIQPNAHLDGSKACGAKYVKPLYSNWFLLTMIKCTPCGRGWSHRSVTCMSWDSSQMLADHLCSTKDKPKKIKRCHKRCPQPRWQTGKWSEVRGVEEPFNGYKNNISVLLLVVMVLSDDRLRVVHLTSDSRPNALIDTSQLQSRVVEGSDAMKAATTRSRPATNVST